jgi:hypothetical protein
MKVIPRDVDGFDFLVGDFPLRGIRVLIHEWIDLEAFARLHERRQDGSPVHR